MRRKKEAKATPVSHGSLLGNALSCLPAESGISGKGVPMPRAASLPSTGAELCTHGSQLLSCASSPHPQTSSTGTIHPFQSLSAKLTFFSCSVTLFEETSKS